MSSCTEVVEVGVYTTEEKRTAREDSAAGGELARCGRIAECPSPAERQTFGLTAGDASNRR